MRRIKEAIELHGHKLLKMDNVVGVGIGHKTVSGECTDKMSMVILVQKKQAPEKLRSGQLIPQRIEKAETDVIEVGEIRLLGTVERTQMLRPAQPGVSIGNYRVTAGTFGAVVKDRKTGELLILSNNHVLANASDGSDGKCEIGDPILQPGAYDGGKNEQAIARLEKFIPIYQETVQPSCPIAEKVESVGNRLLHAVRPNYHMRLYKKTQQENLVDAAVAKPINADEISPLILEIGEVKGVKEVELGMRVKKSGRTTGLTEGRVMVLSATLKVALGQNEHAIFRDQFVCNLGSKPGDSGSLVLTQDNEAVGLLFAGSDAVTICNKISHVLHLLDVTF